MAGRKVFTSGEILTAADVNSYLMDQSVMVFADSSARSSAIPTPTEGMVTYREDANRVEVYDGAAFGPIGGILQVASTTKTDTFNTTSSSYIDIPGLSVTITPTASSSKIMVFLNLQGTGDSGNALSFVQLVRDSTSIGIGAALGSRTRASFSLFDDNASTTNSGAMQVLDEPSATSPVTYKVQGFSAGSNVFYVNQSKTDSDSSDFGRFASTITVMEVA